MGHIRTHAAYVAFHVNPVTHCEHVTPLVHIEQLLGHAWQVSYVLFQKVPG